MQTKLSELSPEQIRAYKEAGVLDEIIASEKNNVTSGLAFSRPVYAPRTNDPTAGGIFTQPGVRPQMVSTLIQPLDITSTLNPQPSTIYQERVAILSGQTAATGTNPNDTCGDPPRVGMLKTCQQNYIYGEFIFGSNQIKISDAGMMANRAVTERQIMNEAAVNPFFPAALQGPNVDFMSIEAQQLYQLGTSLRRQFSQVFVTGDSTKAPASTALGFVREFNGIDTMIKTGYTDVITGVACPAADSVVIPFNADIYTGTYNGYNLTRWMSDLFFGRVTLAKQLGISATWHWEISPATFRELTYAFANQYYDTRQTGSAGNPFVNQQTQIRQLQMEMLNGAYLLMDGQPVPVIFSDGIPINVGGGNYQKTDIYLVCDSVDGREGVHVDYFPMDNPNAAKLANRFNNEIQMLNNGMYILYAERSKGCMELVIEGKIRMYLEAPFLCGKIQGLLYQSNISYRSPITTFTGYVNGGSTGYFPINVDQQVR